MKKLLSMFVVGGVLSAASLSAWACGGGGGGCGMGGGRGYYGGGRSVASTKVLSGGPRVARYGASAGRALANAAKPAPALAGAKKAAPTQAVRTVAAKTKTAAPPIYSCPMHPQVQWTKPTDCPICGMKLKLKQAKGDATRRTPPASEGADMSMDDMSMDEMGDMAGMEDETGGMDDMGMCCPGCMGGMSGMSGGKKSPPASRKASGRSMRGMGGMAGMGCGC